MIIKDGDSGYTAKVDQYNRLYTKALVIPEVAYISTDTQESYNVTTPPLTFNSENEHPMLLLQNKRSDLTLILTTITYSWNGGNTNHDRAIIKRVYRNPPVPTDNYEMGNCANTNFGSSKEPQSDCYIWDESTSDGMTIDLSGIVNMSTDIINSSPVLYDSLEAWRLTYNDTILFTFEPEEIGVASVSLKYYFNH